VRFDIQKFLFAAVLAILCYLVIPPLFFTIQSSFYVAKGFEPPSFSLKNYKDLLSTPGTGPLLLNSLWFAVGSSVVALVIGTLLAWIVERTNTPYKNLAY